MAVTPLAPGSTAELARVLCPALASMSNRDATRRVFYDASHTDDEAVAMVNWSDFTVPVYSVPVYPLSLATHLLSLDQSERLHQTKIPHTSRRHF